MNSIDAAKPDVWRLFVAVDLPIEVKRRLEQVQRELKQASWRARWTNPENAHLTLKFIGDFAVDSVEALSSTLRESLRSEASFEIYTSAPGAFPNFHRPRVIWLGIEDRSGSLAKTANRIEVATRSLGIEPDERAFRAHLTIARVRPQDSGTITNVDKHFARIGRLDHLRFAVDHVTLYQSELNRSGPTYTVIERFELRNSS